MRLSLWWAALPLVACGGSEPTTQSISPGTGGAGASAGAGAGGTLGGMAGATVGVGGGAGSGGIGGLGGSGGLGGAGTSGAGGNSGAGGAGKAGGGTGGTGAAGTGGKGGGGSAATSGAGGMPECLDARFVHPPFAPANHAFWRDSMGLHVAAFTSKSPGGMNVGTLSIASFSPTTGAALGTRVLDVFPPDLTSEFENIVEAAADGVSTFAVLIRHRYPPDAYSTYNVVIGSTASADVQVVGLPVTPADAEGFGHIGWNGERFAIHGRRTDNAFVVLRMDSKGVFSGGPMFVGPIGNMALYGFEMRTDAATGVSWYVGKAGVGVYLTGHDRPGNAFPKPSPTDLYNIKAKGVCPQAPGDMPAVGIVDDGAMVSWSGIDGRCFQRVGSDLQAKGAAFLVPPDIIPPKGYSLELLQTTIQRVGTQWWVGARDLRGIWSMWLDDASVLSRTKLVTFSKADCFATDTCGLGEVALDARNLTTTLWNDELWLGFWDLSAQGSDGMEAYRMVRVSPGCTYPSMWDVLHP